MRHIIVRAFVVAALLFGTTLAFAFSTGPPPSRTGGFMVAGKSAEPNCTVCHLGGAPNSDPKGSLQLLDVPAQYGPGGSYVIRVRLNYDWNPLPADPVRWGFQMTAVKASTGDGVGSWVLGANAPPDTFRILNGLSTTVWRTRRYVEHTRDLFTDAGATHTGESGPIEWHVIWQAPPGDSGTIYFFAAGNAANGDGDHVVNLDGTFDHIYTTADSTTGGGTVAVPRPPEVRYVTALAEPFPNPFNKCVDLTFTVARAGEIDLSIYDLQGRRMRTILHGHHEVGSDGTYWNGRRDDGTLARNGVYFARLQAAGLRRPMAKKLTLAR